MSDLEIGTVGPIPLPRHLIDNRADNHEKVNTTSQRCSAEGIMQGLFVPSFSWGLLRRPDRLRAVVDEHLP